MIISQRTFVILLLFGLSHVRCETNLKSGEQTIIFISLFLYFHGVIGAVRRLQEHFMIHSRSKLHPFGGRIDRFLIMVEWKTESNDQQS